MSADTDGPWDRYIKMLKADIDGKDTYTLEEGLVKADINKKNLYTLEERLVIYNDIYNGTQIAKCDKVKRSLVSELLDQLSGKPPKKIENS